MTSRTLLGLGAFQWTALIAAFLSLLVVAEAWLGHYRSGFPLRAQYAPLASGCVLALASVAAVVAPRAEGARAALAVAAWIAIVSGLVGVGYHHWYGIVEKAGGYRWLLHYLMYGAPKLAPLALAAAGVLTLVVAAGLAGEATLGGVALRRVLYGVVAVALIGAILQAGILHYRGAFNTPVMYGPLLVPPLAVFGVGWLAIAPGAGIAGVTRVLLWLTVLTSFVGLGMHLRGLDRQMGGLWLWRMNLLQGPPPLAPATFASFAAIGLVTLDLL